VIAMTVVSNDNWRPGAKAKATVHAKRIIDVVGSSIGLVALAPVFVLIALAIRLESRGPVFFLQERAGREGKPFWIYKFRSMRHNESGQGGAPLTVRGDSRVTRVGALLRKLKLDELPQLMNVVKGEMSLVGPRPESLELATFYSPEEASIILSVRPGMTDLGSLYFVDESELLDGRSEPVDVYRRVILPAKVRLYRLYVANMTVGSDLKIIAQTLGVLLFGRSASFVRRGLSHDEALAGLIAAPRVKE
jgi:lipopolysaccharide/colanic/teichoic acid biosynthesis glycosyltransferase